MSESTVGDVESAPPDIYSFGPMKMTPERQAIIGRAKADVLSRRCPCPTCAVSRSLRTIGEALEQLDGATEAWANRECELEMSHAWLYEEVEAVLALPWWRRSTRRRLARAFDCVRRDS